MMLDAGTRAVYRAEEQMSSGSWRTPDPDETERGDTATHCIVCDVPLIPFLFFHAGAGKMVYRNPTKGQKVCRACSQKGWRTRPCLGCGGPTKTWAWSSKARCNARRGLCDSCQDALHQDNPIPSGGRGRFVERGE